ncbi:Polyketide cyclase / dehydrase and lipid transport [Friedmanniella luteola]|uniref:Polyketide cyclase / dehydrase and lipid transport n=1 Tax=Friedmanniella luteola TaxID=546871 RepID=A0A1H1SFM9_9ACTN|nr:SRPBCC family protein [Friedmanniella luteola]SDS46767.1 Polyketide cyclase / dehydrase and lipid transport [Friedmanniella luteola]
MADTYTVSRTLVVDAPPERVHAQLADFHRWAAWSPWEDVDPALERSYEGAGSGVGAVYRWSGNRRAGRGRMEITESRPPALVRVDLTFEKPFKAHNDTWFEVVPEGAGSRVTWTMTGRLTVVTRLMGLFSSMDKFLGPDFEKGLQRLKTVSESAAA